MTDVSYAIVSFLKVDKSVGCVNVDIAHLQTVSTLMKGIIFVSILVKTAQVISVLTIIQLKEQKMIFRMIKNWFYDPNRFYFFTGANDNHTNCAREELENAGIIYAEHEIYNYEPNFDGKYTLGLGDLSILARIKVRFIFWKGGIKGRLWYTI